MRTFNGELSLHVSHVLYLLIGHARKLLRIYAPIECEWRSAASCDEVVVGEDSLARMHVFLAQRTTCVRVWLALRRALAGGSAGTGNIKLTVMPNRAA